MCSCGMNKKLGGVQKWLLIKPDGTKVSYDSETTARMAASQIPGSRVRQG